jgi:hypothetical protein
MILYLLLLLKIVTANNCIKIGELGDNIIYACPIQLLNETTNILYNPPITPSPVTFENPYTAAPAAPAAPTPAAPAAPAATPAATPAPAAPAATPAPAAPAGGPVVSPTPAEPAPAPQGGPVVSPAPAGGLGVSPTPEATPVLIDEVVLIDKNTTEKHTQNTTQNNTNKIIENYTGIIISSIVILIILIIIFFIKRKGTKNKICDSPKNDIEKQFVGNASSSTEETIAITSGTIEQSNRPLPRTHRMSNVLESKIPTAKPLRKPPRPARSLPRIKQALLRTLPPLPKKPAPPDHPPPTVFSDTIADMPEIADMSEKNEGKIESKESEIYEDDFEE